MFCSLSSPVEPGTCWKGLNREQLLSGTVQPVGLQCVPCLPHVHRTGFWGPNSAALVVQSALHTPELFPRKGWGPVLKCGVVTPRPLQPLLDVTVSSCQRVMLPAALCHILGASSTENEPPQFVLFILAGFSLNIQVKQVLARLFLQPRCEEPRALGQPIRRQQHWRESQRRQQVLQALLPHLTLCGSSGRTLLVLSREDFVSGFPDTHEEELLDVVI